MKISIIGLGHVGTVFAACLAYRGFDVIGVDVDKSKVDIINKGKSPFYEPGLDDILSEAVAKGKLVAITDGIEAVKETDISVIFVGTPSLRDGSANLKYVKAAAEIIGRGLRHKSKYHVVVVRSTVPPGTTEGLIKEIIENVSGKKAGRDFGLCMNPEFTREGNAVEDTFNPSRIVIGEFDKRSGDVLENLYREFHKDKMPPLIRTTLVNAELIKYASNAFLAMKISFINLIARLCEKLPGADVEVVARGMGLDPRIGPHFLKAGLGFGGSCLPKDLRALIHVYENLGINATLLKEVLRINYEQPRHVLAIIKNLLGNLAGKKICVLGLSFKGGTDDIRESRSIDLVKLLCEEGTTVKVYDPKAMDKAKSVLGNKGLIYAETIMDCIEGSECVIIATDWPDFATLTPEVYKKLKKNTVIVDARRIIDVANFKKEGIRVYAIGLGPDIKCNIINE